MKKLLIGLIMLIPLLIVASVLFITEVVLITPDISVTSVEIVDEYQVGVDEVTIENFTAGVTQYILYASVSPKKASNRKVSWAVKDEVAFDPSFTGHLAEVHVKDLVATVTIYGSGTFRLEARTDDGGYVDSCLFTVKSGVAKTGYIVYNENILKDSGSTLTMAVDEIKKLDACARPTDVDIRYIKWTSSDESILKVDANGVIVPKKSGTATITMELQSVDGYDNVEKKVISAPIITDTITVNVTAGDFNVSSYNVCGTDRVALDVLGATSVDFVAGESENASIVGNELVFSATSGKAVLRRNGKTIVINRYESADKILFENESAIKDSTIIVGRIPFTLNVVNAIDGSKASNITYSSLKPEIATIDANTGLINAISNGEVTFTATKEGGESIEITLNVKEPVVFFALEQDTLAGIAQDYVYGTLWYKDDLTLTTDRQIKIVSPSVLSGKNDLFEWSVTSDDNIASIDQNGVITLQQFAEKVRKNVTVSATAKYSSYTCDNITHTYTFSVMQGVNITNQAEAEDASMNNEYEMFVQSNIRFRTDWNYIAKKAVIVITKDLYGNGYTWDWKHIDSPENKVTDNDIKGAKILQCYGPYGEGDDYLTISNIRLRSSMLPASGQYSVKSFGNYCVRTNGRVYIKYSVMDTGENCIVSDGFFTDDYRRGYKEDEESKKLKIVEKTKQSDIPDLIIEGCIMSNSSKYTVFLWGDIPFAYTKIKNCVFGQSAIPSIGYTCRYQDENNVSLLEIEGFCYIYNWKQSVNMDLIGGILGNQLVDNILKEFVNEQLAKPEYQQYFKTQNGIQYMHCGMMFNGLNYKSDVQLIGDIEENGFKTFSVDYGTLLDEYSFLKSALGNSLYPSYMVGYYGNDYPISFTDTFSPTDELYKMLREGNPNFGK